MKLSQVRVHSETAATAAALDTAVNTWLAGRAEQTFVRIEYQVMFTSDLATKEYSALIVYTE
jgi:hypothetical protein